MVLVLRIIPGSDSELDIAGEPVRRGAAECGDGGDAEGAARRSLLFDEAGVVVSIGAGAECFPDVPYLRFSIWVDKPTPGNALRNLKYRDDRAVIITGKKVRTGLEGPGLSVSQKIGYCIRTVGSQYLWAHLQSFSAFRRWGDSEQRSLARHLWVLIQHVEGLYKAASFANLLIFLYTGRCRSIIERVLQARIVYGSLNMNRSVCFEYMNRQLVWNEFSEMLLLLLPFLNSLLIRKFLLLFSKDKSSGSSNDETLCPVCHANPTIPFVALPCQQRHCYYCLCTRSAAACSYRCARCNEPVAAI